MIYNFFLFSLPPMLEIDTQIKKKTPKIKKKNKRHKRTFRLTHEWEIRNERFLVRFIVVNKT